MIDQIVAALRARHDLEGWTVRQITSVGAQLYAVSNAVEASREVTSERYVVDVLSATNGPDGDRTVGAGNTTLLPGDDVDAALDAAVLMASLVHNPPYSMPVPAPLPDVPLVDPRLANDAGATLHALLDRLRSSVAAQPGVLLTAAEFFGETQTTRLRNSRDIDATQTTTHLHSEWVLLRRNGEQEVESFVELTRRRVDDYPIEEEVARRAQFAADTLAAAAAPNYTRPVVMCGATLSVFLNGGVIHTLSSGAAKYGKLSRWEIGQPVFRGEVLGDPLTVFANRRLPFGNHANRFDDEGLPAQRVALIRDNVLQTFIADQRYAEYLDIAPAGRFGDIELPAGSTPAATLLQGSYVEVVAFSWFNPDSVTGDFASEIRLGYIIEGDKRTPFKGGTLVGNVLTALANVRWSAETAFLGDYLGPTTARFGQLTVAGVQET
jgi:predicted Zn-dependent protease